MFNVGDLIIYSTHGLCHIDDICEKTYSGETKTYYVLHPLDNEKLQINTPVNNKTISMLEIMDKKEAEEILSLFTLPGIDWIEKSHQRTQTYSEVTRKGNRKEIARVINTLMLRKHEIELNGKKFSEYDRKLLTSMQNILFHEIAISLNIKVDGVLKIAEKNLNINQETLLKNLI